MVKWTKNYLSDVLYVPEMNVNLFSSGACLDKGIKMVSDKNMCKFIKNGKVVAVGTRDNKLFTMKFRPIWAQEITQANVAKKVDTLEQWHIRLCHQNVQYVMKYLSRMQIPFVEPKNDFFCEACIYGKQHRESFTTSKTKTAEPGEIVHTDVCGPMEHDSLGGKKYFVLFKDDYTNYRYVYFLKHKSEVKEKLQIYLNLVKNQINISVKVLRSDNGLEYVNDDVKSLLEKSGIQHQKSTPYTPQQNGSAERDMRTIVEAARTLISSKNLSKNLWAEAVNTVVYVLNHTGNSGHDGKKN